MIDVINLKKSFGSVEVLKGINMTINNTRRSHGGPLPRRQADRTRPHPIPQKLSQRTMRSTGASGITTRLAWMIFSLPLFRFPRNLHRFINLW